MAEKRTKADKLQRAIERNERRFSVRVEEANVESKKVDQPASPKGKRAA